MAFVLRATRAVSWTAILVVLVYLCSIGSLRAEEEEDFLAIPSREDDEFQAAPSNEDEEGLGDPFGGGVQEEDLPSEEPASSSPGEGILLSPEIRTTIPSVQQHSLPPTDEQSSSSMEYPLPLAIIPAPVEIPPFMSRPLEWEVTPPTVIGMPPLPASTSFSEREFVAFKFVEEGKENFDREDWEQAQEQFERAISLAPFLPYSYYFLGRVALSRGDHKRALAFLRKAELLFPRTDRAWLGETTGVTGTIYEEMQDYPQARAAYRRSLRFQPTNLKVLSALARLPEEEPFSNDAISQ